MIPAFIGSSFVDSGLASDPDPLEQSCCAVSSLHFCSSLFLRVRIMQLPLSQTSSFANHFC